MSETTLDGLEIAPVSTFPPVLRSWLITAPTRPAFLES
jgi:hypothetical protein